MVQLAYECENGTKAGGLEPDKPYPCPADKYCFYCGPQCCLVIQRRPPKHFWEAWYFWLGLALLLVILVSTVGAYVVTNCKQNLQAVGHGRNNGSSRSEGREPQQQQRQPNRNEISINIIPTSAVMPTHRKIMFIAPQPSCAHLTPIVA